MFFNLFGKKAHVGAKIIDLTYMSEQAKYDAIVTTVRQNSSLLLLTWFTETASFYKKLFAEKGLDENRVVETKHYSSLKYPGRQIIAAEHYPLPAKETNFFEQLHQENLNVYNSITDPLLKLFGGEKIATLMQSMGVKSDEVISHEMITRSIHRAQEKIAQKVTSEHFASSQEEWFHRNFSNDPSGNAPGNA